MNNVLVVTRTPGFFKTLILFMLYSVWSNGQETGHIIQLCHRCAEQLTSFPFMCLLFSVVMIYRGTNLFSHCFQRDLYNLVILVVPADTYFSKILCKVWLLQFPRVDQSNCSDITIWLKLLWLLMLAFIQTNPSTRSWEITRNGLHQGIV